MKVQKAHRERETGREASSGRGESGSDRRYRPQRQLGEDGAIAEPEMVGDGQ
jgi:hypothetical protein